MRYRKEILNQLYKVLENNTTDARIYFRLADNCKRSSLRYFFKKLSLQKRLFCRRIGYEIRELEKEIEYVNGNTVFQKENIAKKSIHEISLLSADMIGLITYCYKREQEYLELYKTLLSQTNLGSIREMLLSQKHSVQLILNEINSLRKKVPNIKNDGEISYS